MDLKQTLKEINVELKKTGCRAAVAQKRDSLYLQATFPSKKIGGNPSQQYLPLRLKAAWSSLDEAQAAALRIDHELKTGVFSWATHLGAESLEVAPGELTVCVRDFIKAAEELHRSKYRKNPESGSICWAKKWKPSLAKLPPSQTTLLDEARFIRIIKNMPQNSAARRDQGAILVQVAKSLGFNIEKMREASKGYGAAQLTPREIPSDELIEKTFNLIKLPHWKWLFGICATYGLRPHEALTISWEEDNWLMVADETKTGTRKVCPCKSEWVEKFQLQTLPIPTQDPRNVARIGSDAFERDGVEIRLYQLRHAYAIRLFEKGVAADLAAKLMGHSVAIHETTYRRWLQSDRIKKAMTNFSL